MSIPDHRQPAIAPPPSAVVVTAVVVRDASRLPDALDAVAAQSYETAQVVVVGGGEDGRIVADKREAQWVAGMRDVASVLLPAASHVWMLHDDARPRGDALAALVGEAQRVDASVAGSKLLRADRPELLESVGAATDVFCVPYSGLDPDELDQEQYDVVRDVAFVSGVSALIRKDLFRGLGGADGVLAPEAAGIDLSQRARLAGGRIVVIPSSEVVHEGRCVDQSPRWREEAGRLRALLKVYRPVTLMWTVPLALVSGLLYAVVMTFLGRARAVPDLLLNWGWNLYYLPSTIAARRNLRRARMAGDEELFRYQVRGSVQLRELGDRLTSRVRIGESEQGYFAELVERGRGFWQDPGFYATVGGALFLALTGRALLAGGLPVSGLALPLPDSGLATLRSYAGGWNTSGLGSPAPLHPSIGATALVQLVLLSREGFASVFVTFGAAAAGLIGTVRLLRRLEVGAFARYAAAVALIGGPATRALAGAADWPGMIAIGLAPWAVGTLLAPWPNSWRRRIGYLAKAGLSSGALAVFAPVTILLPLIALAVRAVVSHEGGWAAPLRAVPAAVLALPFLFPWLYRISPARLLAGGTPEFFEPSEWVIAGVLAALGLALLVGDRRTASLAGWGGILTAGGAFLARTAELGVGREPVVAGYVAAAVGTAVIVGAAIDLRNRLDDAGIWRTIAGRAAVLAGLMVAAGALLLVPSGRLGLPADQFGAQLEFAEARAQDHGVDRILLIGPADNLPGEARSGEGYAYRVVAGNGATYPEAWLPAAREGDRALAAVLEEMLAGDNLRPGSALARFGIRWVVFTGPNPLEAALESQLDLRQLPGLDYPTFENEVFSPRALGTDGTAWIWERPDYVGSGAGLGPVYVAENQDARWGEVWQASGWANEVGVDEGRITFSGDPVNRGWALSAAALLGVLIVAGLVGRRGDA